MEETGGKWRKMEENGDNGENGENGGKLKKIEKNWEKGELIRYRQTVLII